MTSTRAKATNVPSLLLQDHENSALFQAMGRLCVTLATGVVQLYLADQPDRKKWTKRCCGVACFVKDSSKKSFFIRVYGIKKQQMIWEQELYNQFVYKSPREYFHTFEADTCQAGMNFASEDEAMKFKKAVEGKLNERKAKRQARRQTVAQKPGNNRAPPSTINSRPSIPQSAPPTTIVVDTGRSNNNISSSSGTLKKEKDKKKDGKKKLTKADIGTPSNFRHVGHVGWDPDKGFDMNNLEPDMQMLFQSVGINADDNVDKETVDFIYDFVEKHGGIEAVKKELVNPAKPSGALPPPPPSARGMTAPPPPPSRNAAPPPPPSRAGVPPPPPPSRGPPPPRGSAPPPPPSRAMPPPPKAPSGAPPPPPPASIAHPPPPPPMGGAPPPPPPPPPAGAPPPPPPPSVPGGGGSDGRGALLQDIRSGLQLKPTQTNSEPARSSDSRGQLLDDIRQGRQLKKVDQEDRPVSNNAPMEMNGLVGALAKALASRRPACVNSDDEDDSDDDDDDVSDDDDWDD